MYGYKFIIKLFRSIRTFTGQVSQLYLCDVRAQRDEKFTKNNIHVLKDYCVGIVQYRNSFSFINSNNKINKLS